MDRLETLDVGELPPQVGDLLAGRLEVAPGSRAYLGECNDLGLQAVGEPGILLGVGPRLGEPLGVSPSLLVEGRLVLGREAGLLGLEGLAMPCLEGLAGGLELFGPGVMCRRPGLRRAQLLLCHAKLLGELGVCPGVGPPRVFEGPSQVVELIAAALVLERPLHRASSEGIACLRELVQGGLPLVIQPRELGRPRGKLLLAQTHLFCELLSPGVQRVERFFMFTDPHAQPLAFGMAGRQLLAERFQLPSEALTLGVGFRGRLLAQPDKLGERIALGVDGFETARRTWRLPESASRVGAGALEGLLQLLDLFPQFADLVPGTPQLLVALHQGLGEPAAGGQLALEGLDLEEQVVGPGPGCRVLVPRRADLAGLIDPSSALIASSSAASFRDSCRSSSRSGSGPLQFGEGLLDLGPQRNALLLDRHAILGGIRSRSALASLRVRPDPGKVRVQPLSLGPGPLPLPSKAACSCRSSSSSTRNRSRSPLTAANTSPGTPPRRTAGAMARRIEVPRGRCRAGRRGQTPGSAARPGPARRPGGFRLGTGNFCPHCPHRTFCPA